jgi:hypothetical protein
MRYFATADVHGFYDELMKALDNAGFNQNEDTLIICGDLFDRGEQAQKCLAFVDSLPHKVCILGNHELLLKYDLDHGFLTTADVQNGTASTILQLSGGADTGTVRQCINGTANNPALKRYLSSLVPYFELGDNLFVHGWIPSVDYQKAHHKDWEDATWRNGIEEWHDGNKISGKTIWCGHWNTSFGNFYYHHKGNGEYEKDSDFEPFIDDGIVALDACTVVSGFVNVVEVKI